MAGHKGLINTSFYFGLGQESESRIALGHGGAGYCVHRALRGKYGAASTDPRFTAPHCDAVTLDALLGVIKKKLFNTSASKAVLYCVKGCFLYIAINAFM